MTEPTSSATEFGSTQPVRKGKLIIEGVPEIPPRISERLAQYQHIRSATLCDWLADGKGLVVSTRFAETSQIHVVNQPGGCRRQITFFDEPVDSARVCPDASADRLLLTRDVGGSEFHQVFLLDPASGECRMLSDGKSRNGSVVWSQRGDRFAYHTTRRNGRDYDIHVASPEGESTQVLEGQGQWRVLDWSSDDSRLLLLRFASINESYLHVLDVADGKLTELAPSSEKVSIGEALFTRDGKGVYFTSDASSEFMQLRRLDLASGQVKDLAADLQWNVSDLALAHDGNQLAFVTNEDGYNCLHILDTATGQQRPVPDMPRGVIGGLRFSPDDSRLAMTIDTPCQPADVYVLELARSELVRWTCTETAGLASDGFVEPELIRYETFDNADGSPRTIPAYYYKPAGDGPFPVLILIHGGPEGQSRPNFSPSIQYWVRELGLAVLVPNVRGSAGYGKSYLLLDNGRRREDSVRDIGSLLDWIDGRDELDQARVGVTGNSYGGYMTLACLCHYNDRLRAGVEAVGVANFVTFLENTQAYRRDWRRQEYGDERDPEMRQFLLDISPTTNVHKITRPLLIAQGLNDPRVPASESEQMVRVIREAGGMVAYVAAEDEGHGFRRKTNRDYWAQATALFLERYLV